MQGRQKGFTLIELVVVIVILGILAATALPKFINLSGDAGDSAAKGVVGALNSALSMNYGKYQIDSSAAGGAVNVNKDTKCSDLTPLMAGGALPADITFVTGTATLSTCTKAGDQDTTHCMIKHSKGTTTGGFAVTATCTS